MPLTSFFSIKNRAFALPAAAVGLLAVVVAFGAGRFSLLHWIAAAQRWVQSLGPATFVAYPLLYAGCNVLLLPAGILVVGAGFFFGFWGGFFIVLSGNVLGAAVALALTRLLARKWVERRMLARPRWRAMDEIIGEKGGRIVFLSQLHPLFPTSLLNYFYGITRLPFWSCLGWIALGQIPGLLLYVYLGTVGEYGLQLLQERARFQLGAASLWIAGLIAALAATALLARLSANLLKEIDARAAAAS